MTIHETVSLTSDDRVLAGTLVTPDSPSGAAVLFVHGLGSSRGTNVERAEAVSRSHSATCLAIDLGGHGDSTGRLTQVTPRQNLADVVAAHDRLGRPRASIQTGSACARPATGPTSRCS